MGKAPEERRYNGENFMDPFKPTLKSMVVRGCAEKIKRLGASQMQEKMNLIYSTRLDIPAVHNITSYVNYCLRSLRKDVRRAVDGLPPETGRYSMPEKYATCLEEIVLEIQTLMKRFIEDNLPQRTDGEAQ